MKSYLNVGCGTRYSPEWTNIDCFEGNENVLCFDLRKGIPFPDGHFDVVYHSHLLEHFSKQAAPAFLRECHRVLRKGGIIRIAVPDLEKIAKLYLQSLNELKLNDTKSIRRYEWIILEMFDQVSRDQSGGEVASFLNEKEVPREFIRERWGKWADDLLATAPSASDDRNFVEKQFARFAYYPTVLKEKLLKRLLGEADYRALKIGQFRQSGEVHRWMYDRVYLAYTLRKVGFEDPHPVEAHESAIPNWSRFHLDTEPSGEIYKADSLYMEASKP